MNEFREAMKNAVMKQEYTAFIKEKKPETLDAFAEAVADFAAAKGFSIRKEDVLNSIPDEQKSGKTELTDDMLDNVVGGRGRCIYDWIHEVADDFVNMLEDHGLL